jgi:signal transduction histidine kinase
MNQEPPATGVHGAKYDHRSRNFDALIATASTLLSISVLFGFMDDLDGGTRVLAVTFVVVNSLALLWRRRLPWVTLAVNIGAALAIVALGLPLVVLHLTPLIALYSLASNTPRERSAWGLGAALVVLLIAEAASGFAETWETIAGNVVGLFSAWLLGTFVFNRQIYMNQLEIRTRELEEARDELAKKILTEERLRIARELHDVVAHSLSLIAVQSGVGAHVGEQQPEHARRALHEVERTSRQALDEMRRLLGVLRSDEVAHLGPVPSLDGLPSLVEQVSATGPKIELRIHGEPQPLSPSIDLTAYRIVQESLTNVVKHARATEARTVLTYFPNRLVIEIVDNGSGPPPTSRDGGHGLAGMRERVAMFGGSLDAGPLRDGGFRVHAEFPLTKESS